MLAVLIAVASALCFGIALVTGRMGLRTLDARAGAAISIPTATLLFVLAAPFALELDFWDVRAVAVFAVVGVFFPALVTLLTFRANRELGPTVTGAVSGTAPLFALLGAAYWLNEAVPPQAAAAAGGVVLGVALLSWQRGAPAARRPLRLLLWPLSGALVRGLAQAGAKAGLLIWPNAYAAGLIGYLVSSAVVLTTGRARGALRTRSSVRWFALTGVLNGAAVLLMYVALSMAPVAVVAPIVAAYPLVTTLASAALLREDRLTAPKAAGALVTVAAIVFLVATR